MEKKEYIDREAALRAVKSVSDGDYGVSAAAYAITQLPAADVVEVVHGEWLLKHEGYGHYWLCSVCRTNPCIYVTENTKFCPNCGAKMDGGKE